MLRAMRTAGRQVEEELVAYDLLELFADGQRLGCRDRLCHIRQDGTAPCNRTRHMYSNSQPLLCRFCNKPELAWRTAARLLDGGTEPR